MKTELRENMYIRTKDGYTSQYKYYDTTNMGKLLCIPLSNGTFANIEDIVKASYNIIDILEVGDYVNGYKVSAIYNPNGDEVINITLIMEYGYETINTYFNDYSINSIVTHEQMEQMAYKVGE